MWSCFQKDNREVGWVRRDTRLTIDRLYYYGLGTRFGASRPFDHGIHARSIAFCTFRRHFLGQAWLWTTVFFLACLKNTVDVWWCARPTLAPEKVHIWATYTLAGVARLLPSLRVGRLDLSSARVTFLKRKNPSHPGGKMLVWITYCENEATSVCLQVRVPREWSSRQRGYMGAICIATERSAELQTSIQQAHHYRTDKWIKL